MPLVELVSLRLRSDGTRPIASAHGTPALGSWRLSAGGFDHGGGGNAVQPPFFASSRTRLVIRMANLGEAITIEPACHERRIRTVE